MTGRLPPRYGYVLATVLFAAAGVMALRAARGALDRARLHRPPPPRPAMVALTFPPPPPADLVDPIPTSAEASTVDALVAKLSSEDPVEQGRALTGLELLPYTDLPVVEAAAGRPGLPVAAADRLAATLPRLRARAKAERRRSHDEDGPVAAFYEREALAEYAAGGHTDARWDAAAQTFLHLANVRRQLHRPAALAANLAECRRQGDVALAAGCNDPTVLACAGLVSMAGGDPEATAQGYFARAERAGGGGPLFRLIADDELLRPTAALGWAGRLRHKDEISGRLVDMGDRFASLAAVPGVSPAVAERVADETMDRVAETGWTLLNIVHRLYEPLAKAVPAGTPGLLEVKGRAYMHWAWEARGSGYADTVSEQGWRDFHDRLAVAAGALGQAYAADPDDGRVGAVMIAVACATDQGRGTMRTWYRRAMDADPDNAAAVSQFLEFSEPKWGGSPELMLGFGRQCVAEGNWQTRIPCVLVKAHDDLAALAGGDERYWLLPGVWDDVRSVWAGYVERFPGRPANASQLAAYALRCHQWKAADEQFKRLGDRAVAAYFGDGSPAALDQARRVAARLADDPDEQGR